jgi:hypothetical protein
VNGFMCVSLFTHFYFLCLLLLLPLFIWVFARYFYCLLPYKKRLKKMIFNDDDDDDDVYLNMHIHSHIFVYAVCLSLSLKLTIMSEKIKCCIFSGCCTHRNIFNWLRHRSFRRAITLNVTSWYSVRRRVGSEFRKYKKEFVQNILITLFFTHCESCVCLCAEIKNRKI